MKRKTLVLAFAGLVFSLQPLIALSCDTDKIKSSHASILMGPPNQVNTAGYAHLKNEGKEACVLVGASSAISEKVELHTMKNVDGMMKMQQVHEFTIPASGELLLAPGGNHLMFMNLKEKLKAKEDVAVTLKFKDNKEMVMQAKVQDMRETPHAEKH